MENTAEIYVRDNLTAKTTAIDALSDHLLELAEAHKPLVPGQLKEIMKQLSDNLEACEDVVDGHATGDMPVSHAMFPVVAGLMRAIHQTMSAIVLIEAKRSS